MIVWPAAHRNTLGGSPEKSSTAIIPVKPGRINDPETEHRQERP